MKRFVLALALLMGVSLAGAPDEPPPALTLRVLTYNIHHGEGTDGIFDLSRQAAIISGANPDLVALQEVDDGTERAGGKRQLEELGRLTGLHPTFGRAIDFESGRYGVGILTRWAPVGVTNRALPGTTDREARTALTVTVPPAARGPRINFTSTHFDQGRDESGRILQATAINERLIGNDSTVSILAGDFNSAADSSVMQTLRVAWTLALPVDQATTGPSGRPSFRVDHVLVRPASRWRVVESRVVDAPLASDHRPVLVVLELLPVPSH